MASQSLNYLRLVVPLLVLIVHAAWSLWLRTRPKARKATIEPGQMIFQPVQEVRSFFLLTAVLLMLFLVWCLISCEPTEQWLVYICVALLVALGWLYPRTLIIETQAVISRNWFGQEKTMRWEDVTELDYAMDKNSLTLMDRENRRIVHHLIHPEPLLFRNTVRERTRLPLKITHRKSLKQKTIALPYRDRR